jgi:hypothetical protein
LKFLVETGRFVLTALAVALAGPTVLTILDLSSGGMFSVEWHFGFGALIFVLTMIGGLIAGLPALWFAKRHGWDRRIGRMLIVGMVAGAIAGALLAIPFWGGFLAYSLLPVVQFATFGGLAGLMAAPIWVMLHRQDLDSEPT